MRLQQAISQGSVTKFLAVYDHPFWREDGLSGEGFAPYGLVRELYDNTPPSASVGVLCTFLPGEQADVVARMSPEARRTAILDGLAAFVGPEALARDRPDRDGLVGRGVDARRVRVDVRDRRAHPLRPRPPAPGRPDPLGVRRHRRRRAHAHGRRRALGRGAAADACSPALGRADRPRSCVVSASSDANSPTVEPVWPRVARTTRQRRKPTTAITIVSASVSVASAFSAGVGAVRPASRSAPAPCPWSSPTRGTR